MQLTILSAAFFYRTHLTTHNDKIQATIIKQALNYSLALQKNNFD